MPKIIVTDKLADTIKMLRMQNGIKSKDLAHHIEKTPGYVSKLEKQEIKSIEIEMVESIFAFILGEDYKKTEIWEQIYASLQIKHSKAEIENEVWFVNFDTVHRYIPIPDSIVDLLNNKIAELGISRDLLLERINANEALSDEEKNDETIKFNSWYPSKSGKGTSIKIKMVNSALSDILDKEALSAPYIYVFCILYYLLKIEYYGNVVKIEDSQTQQLYTQTTTILNAHKFYSIIERENIVSSAKSKEEIKKLLSSFDNANIKLISEILEGLKFASDLDVRTTNQRLEEFLRNLNENVWFTLKIISLDYHLLEPVDVEQRKEFIKDVEALIHKYTEAHKNNKNTETY